MQTDRQTGRQTSRHAGMQTDTQASREAWACRQADRQAIRQMQAGRKTKITTNMHAGKQTSRQADHDDDDVFILTERNRPCSIPNWNRSFERRCGLIQPAAKGGTEPPIYAGVHGSAADSPATPSSGKSSVGVSCSHHASDHMGGSLVFCFLAVSTSPSSKQLAGPAFRFFGSAFGADPAGTV